MKSIVPPIAVVLREKCKPLNYYSNVEAYTQNAVVVTKQRQLRRKWAGFDVRDRLYSQQKGLCEFCNLPLDDFSTYSVGPDYANCEVHHV